MSKHKVQKVIIGPQAGVTPTKERRRQNGGVLYEAMQTGPRAGQFVRRYRAVWECPLDAYHDCGVLSRAEYRAGLLFHRAYHGLILSRRAGRRPMGEAQAAWPVTKIEKLLNAARKMIDPKDLGTVIDICGHAEPAKNPQALASLKRGLGQLACDWQMAAREVCRDSV